jgi:TIR domain
MAKGAGLDRQTIYSIFTHLLIKTNKRHTCREGWVTEIFFSYSHKDQDRVRPIYDALVDQGFEVFWDPKVPAGTDWDTWIRQHLTDCKCAIVFWSAASVASDNVRHEAMVAKEQGKLITVLLDPLTAQQFPMGLYLHQAANLANWKGEPEDGEWSKLLNECEVRLTPRWVRERIAGLKSDLDGQRTRREEAERRSRALESQLGKKDKACQVLELERDKALDEAAALTTAVEELTKAQAAAQAAITDLTAKVEELTKVRADFEARVIEASQSVSETKQARPSRRRFVAIVEPTVRKVLLGLLGLAVISVPFFVLVLMPRNPPVSTTPPGKLIVNGPDIVEFVGQQGGSFIPPKITLELKSAGTGFGWEADAVGWLRISPKKGYLADSGFATIELVPVISAEKLSPGDNLGQIKFTNDSTKTATILKARIFVPTGELSVDPPNSIIKFEYDTFYGPPSGQLKLQAIGGPVAWVAECTDWLTVTPDKGNLADTEVAEIKVGVKKDNLSGKGRFVGKVVFTNAFSGAKVIVEAAIVVK